MAFEIATPILDDGVAETPEIAVDESCSFPGDVVELLKDDVDATDVVVELVELTDVLEVVVVGSLHVSTPSVVGPFPLVTPYGFGGIVQTGVSDQWISPVAVVNAEISTDENTVPGIGVAWRCNPVCVPIVPSNATPSSGAGSIRISVHVTVGNACGGSA